VLTLFITSLLAVTPPSGADLAPTAAPSLVVLPQSPDRVDKFNGIRPGKDRVDPVRRGGEPVPEPATILLVGSGALGAAYVARRRRRKSASEEIVEDR